MGNAATAKKGDSENAGEWGGSTNYKSACVLLYRKHGYQINVYNVAQLLLACL